MQQLNYQTGGHSFRLDDVTHLQTGTIDALKGICEGLGLTHTTYILSGCIITGTFTQTISAGYIYYNGEIFPVDSQTLPALGIGQSYYFKVQTSVLAPSPVLYQDATLKDVHIRKYINVVAATIAPLDSFLLSTAIRLRQIIGTTPQYGVIMYSGPVTNFTSSGKGIAHTQLDGWALANGNTFTIPGGGSITAPDLRGKFVVGYDNRTTDPGNGIWDILYSQLDGSNHPNGTGGEKSHTLTTPELPSHNHSISNDGTHAHTKTFKVEVNANLNTTGGSNSYLVNDSGTADSSESMASDNSGPHNHSGTTGSTGSGTAHENRPPYYTLAYIIKLL